MALGLSLLRSGYTGNYVRLRRSSDNAEADFAGTGTGDKWLTSSSVAVNGSNPLLDGQSISVFFLAVDGFVTKWYDQSGNARDAVQSTAGNQPQLVSNGALITGSNGRPAIQFTSASSHRMVLSFACPTSALSACGVVKTDSGTTAQTFIGGQSGAFQYNMIVTSGYPRFQRYTVWNVTSSVAISTNWVSLWGHSSGSSQTIYKNNTSEATGANASTFNNNMTRIGSQNANNEHWNGKMHEIVLWPADVGSSGVAIGSANQNARFAIY